MTQDQAAGMGKIMFWEIASNGTIKTLDYYGKYRVLDGTTNNVVYEKDMMAEINAALTTAGITFTETWIKGGYFEVDTGLGADNMLMMTLNFVYE